LNTGETHMILPRRLRIFVASGGKHLFARLNDPRLYLYPGDFDRPPAPDVVVFPCSQPRDYLLWSEELPESVRERVKSGKARILFDASGEGFFHDPETTRNLHAFVEKLGGQVGRAIYITQNRVYRQPYLDWCAGEGVSRPMSVLTYDYWIKRFFGPFETRGEELFQQRLEAFRARPRTRARRFISLNWSPRPGKVFFLMQVLRDRLWDAGYISFGGVGQLALMGSGKRIWGLAKELRRTPGFEDLFDELSPYVKKLAAKGQVQLGELKTGPDSELPGLADDAGLPEYNQSWFSVITETEMSDQPARITEKPFKALVNFHPILVFGNPGALGMIRELGFQTFPEMFDESYDLEPDPRRRFHMAYAEFRRMCQLGKDELRRLEREIAGKLEFNARHGLTLMNQRYRDEIDRAFVDQLIEGWGAASRPGPAAPTLKAAAQPEPAAGWRRLLARP
jgi:hypothetical protein